MSQSKYDRLTKRLSGIEQRRNRGPIMIVRTLGEDPMLRAAAIDPSGKRRVIVINTGIDRDDPDPEYCTRESVAAALPEAKATIAGQRRWEQQRRAAQTTHIDRQNDSDSFADRMEGHWVGLCQRFGLDFEMLEQR